MTCLALTGLIILECNWSLCNDFLRAVCLAVGFSLFWQVKPVKLTIPTIKHILLVRMPVLGMLFILILGGAVQCAYTQSLPDSTTLSLLDRAYALIEKEPQTSIQIFQQVLHRDSQNVPALKQLGYLYIGQNQPNEALLEFVAVQGIAPSDTNRLQIAYLLSSTGRNEEARRTFDELRLSPIPDIRQKAEAEFAATFDPLSVSGSLDTGRSWTHAYAAPYYDTRWEALFFQAHLMHGRYLTADHAVSLYGGAMLSADTKSSGSGLAPIIISDNTFILGAGIRLKPFYGFMVDVQQGIAFDLLSARDPQGDFRGVATYGNGIYPVNRFHNDPVMPWTPYVDLYSSMGYYSRYQNSIGYAQLKGGFRALASKRTTVDMYARLDLAVDTDKEFYNNIAEYGAGVRVTPNFDWGLYLDVEYHHGMYLDGSDAAKLARMAGGYNTQYNSVRLFLILERTF